MKKQLFLFLSICWLTMGNLQSQNIYTFAGTGVSGYSGDQGQATFAQLYFPSSVAFDSKGNLYIADKSNHRVRKIDASGIISTVAGTGTEGFSGDGGQAANAQLKYPGAIAIDENDNLYIVCNTDCRIRKVNAVTGIINTIAGDGYAGNTGDGGQAANAELNGPTGIAVDKAGNIFISDFLNHCIRKIDVSTGIITTVAGTNSSSGDTGDGGAATSAKLNRPSSIAVDVNGDLYICDNNNHCIRKVTSSTGIISTVAGTNSTSGYSGDGDFATSATLYYPYGITLNAGNLYICDTNNHCIRKVDLTTNIITTIAGVGGTSGSSGDEGPATNAFLKYPEGITLDKNGNIYIADYSNHKIRNFTPAKATSVLSAESKNELEIYPNPNDASFIVKGIFENGSILEITDLTGQKVYCERVNAAQNKIQYPVNAMLPKGSYILSIRNNTQNYTSKFNVSY